MSMYLGECSGVIIRLHLADIGNIITETKIRILTVTNIISTEKITERNTSPPCIH